MQQHGSKYFALRYPPNSGRGVKRSNSKFLEQGHVAYQIKWNHEYSNMIAYILPTDPPRWPCGSKGQISFFQNMVMLYINLKGITNAATF